MFLTSPSLPVRHGISFLLVAIILWSIAPLSRADEALVLKAWGANNHGQLEIPSTLNNVTKLSAGGGFILALKSDGTIAAWGFNNWGQTNVPAGLNQVMDISGGSGHSLALRSNGTLLAWGWNEFGQTTIPPEATGVTTIAQGSSNHNLAVLTDQTVLAWGWNDEGQSTVPDDLTGVTAVAMGFKHSLALKSDGTVTAWGMNERGQSTVPAGLTDVIAISAGIYHSLALKSDGTVTAWGGNNHGQRSVPPGLSGVVKISASGKHNTAVKSNGTLVQWGDNRAGHATVPGGLANPAAITDPAQTMVSSGGSFNIAQYATTLFDVTFSPGNHGVIITGLALAKTPQSEAAVAPTIRPDVGWHFTGWDTDFSTVTSALTVTAEYEVKPLVTFVAAPHGTITAGLANQYLVSGTDAVAPVVQADPGWRFLEWDLPFTAITENTTITAVYELMPLVTFSALPHGTITAGEASQYILLGADAVAPTVTADEGWHFTGWDVPFTAVTNNLAVTAKYIPDPTVTFAAGARGRITSGAAVQQVDYGTGAIAPVITPDSGWRFTGWDTEFSAVTADLTTTALYVEWDIDRDSLDDAWEKEIIDADLNDEFITIADVLPGGNPDGDHYTNIQEYERGLNPWVKDALEIHFWGDHRFPVTLSEEAKSARNILDISQGESHSVALLTDGTVIVWSPDGENLPITANLSEAGAISAGQNHNLALRRNGTVIAWGDNTFQQVGVPQGLTNVIEVSAGGTHSLALKSDGTVIAWGNPADGRTTIPVGLANVVAISAGGSHSLALKADGTVVAWGANLSGQSMVPPGLDRVTAISAGTSHSLALLNDGLITAWGAQWTNQVNLPTHQPPPDFGPVSAIEAGSTHSLAIKEGTADGWGNWRLLAQLVKTEPVQAISAGGSYSMTLQIRPWFNVRFDPGERGQITEGLADQEIYEGEAAIAPTITPDANWRLTGWNGEFSDVTRDLTLTAQYEYVLPNTVFAQPIETTITSPSFVTVAFRLTDLAGRGLDIPREIVSAESFFSVLEDGQPLSPSESFLQVAKIDEAGANIRTVLMLDNSFSVAPNLNQIKAAAKTIVSKAVDQQTFAIYSFSGSPVLLQDFTSDLPLLHAAIDSIGLGQPTTNLYGSAITGLSRWTDSYSLDNVTRGFLVLLTDGSDQSALNTLPQVISARGNKRIYTIGLGDEIDQVALNQMGNAGNYAIATVDELGPVFDQIQEEIKNDTNSFYWLNYISPKRGNNPHTLTVRLAGNPYNGANSVLSVNFNSNGFTDVTPEIVLNRSVFNPPGLQTILFSSPAPLTLAATTMLGFVTPNYLWELADPTIAKLTIVSDTEIVLEPLRIGNTTLKITDLTNEAIAPTFYVKDVPVVVEPSGVPGQNITTWAQGFGLTGPATLAGADPNGDGFDNLLSYALGINPVDGLAGSPGAAPPELAMTTPGGILRAQLRFNSPFPRPPELTYIAEQNCNLAFDEWIEIARTSGGGNWTGPATTNETAPVGGYQTVTINSTETIETSTSCFIRIRILGGN